MNFDLLNSISAEEQAQFVLVYGETILEYVEHVAREEIDIKLSKSHSHSYTRVSSQTAQTISGNTATYSGNSGRITGINPDGLNRDGNWGPEFL